MGADEVSPTTHALFSKAWPAIALAVLVLVPYLGKAYTVDDPVFLHEAQQLLHDPFRPAAFEIVWSNNHRLRASAFLPGGPAIAYLLLPLAIADWREPAAHLLTLAYLALAILGTVALAGRLGLSTWGQRAAGVLMGSAPVALGMAGTVMPDIPATMLTVWGIERYLTWASSRRIVTAMAASLLLGAAILTRVNLLVLVGLAGAWSLRHTWRNLWPLVLAVVLALFGFVVTRDIDPRGGTAVSAAGLQLRFGQSGYHLVALAFGLALTTPALIVLLTRRSPCALLWLWLLIPLPILAYVHFAPKYLLPAVPAIAILAAFGLEFLPRRTACVTAATAAGTILGMLVLRADARMANGMREAATQLISPAVRRGETVWYAGHWGFHWYADAAGAQPLALESPFPRPGDLLVVSTVDRPAGLLCTLPRQLLGVWGDSTAGGVVMNGPMLAGFYSDYWGFLPWSYGHPDGWPFEVWRVREAGYQPSPPKWCSK